jgi:hypothetical protein
MLASLVGVCVNGVGQIEHGSVPSLDSLYKIRRGTSSI